MNNQVTLDADSNSGSEDFNYKNALTDSSSASNEEDEKFHRRKRVDIRERTSRPPPIPENPSPLFKHMDHKNAIAPFKRNYDDHFDAKPIKRPSTPPPYLLGKRPAFSSILQGLPKQAQEAPVSKRSETDKPFPFINNFRGGIPPPPMMMPMKIEKVEGQAINQTPNQSNFIKNQPNFQRTPQEVNPQYLINNLNKNLHAIQMNQEVNNSFPSTKQHPHGQAHPNAHHPQAIQVPAGANNNFAHHGQLGKRPYPNFQKNFHQQEGVNPHFMAQQNIQHNAQMGHFNPNQNLQNHNMPNNNNPYPQPNMANMGNNNLMGNRKKVKMDKKKQMVRGVLAPYANKRDTVVVKNLPDHYNSVNCLMDYFKRFGDISNVGTFTKEKLAVIQYKKESFAKKAAMFDAKPFNLNSLRVFIAAEGEHSTVGNEGKPHEGQGYPNKKNLQNPPNIAGADPGAMNNDDSSSDDSISELLKEAAPKKVAPPENPFYHPHTPPPQQGGPQHFNNFDPHQKYMHQPPNFFKKSLQMGHGQGHPQFMHQNPHLPYSSPHPHMGGAMYQQYPNKKYQMDPMGAAISGQDP
jgi:hypothetical protein